MASQLFLTLLSHGIVGSNIIDLPTRQAEHGAKSLLTVTSSARATGVGYRKMGAGDGGGGEESSTSTTACDLVGVYLLCRTYLRARR